MNAVEIMLEKLHPLNLNSFDSYICLLGRKVPVADIVFGTTKYKDL